MKTTIKLIVSLALISILISGCSVDPTPVESTNPAVPIVLGSTLENTVEETYITIGEVIPNNQLDVYLGAIGEIERIFVEPGDFIEEDMPIIQLLNENTQTNFNATESQLRTIRDNLSVQYNATLETFNLQKVLYETGTLSQDLLDASYDQLLITQRQYQDAQVRYNNQVSNLQSSLDDLLVKSPITGQVASLNVQEGQTARNQLAVTVIDNSILYVRTMVASELKKTLQLGQDVRLTIEGVDHVVRGQVKSINEIPDLASKLFEVRVEIMENVPVGVGDFSQVEFVTQAYQAILVPADAIVRKGIEKYVFTYENETLKKVVLETGLSKDNWVEVISDELDGSSTIVIRGQNELHEGDQVLIRP